MTCESRDFQQLILKCLILMVLECTNKEGFPNTPGFPCQYNVTVMKNSDIIKSHCGGAPLLDKFVDVLEMVDCKICSM